MAFLIEIIEAESKIKQMECQGDTAEDMIGVPLKIRFPAETILPALPTGRRQADAPLR